MLKFDLTIMVDQWVDFYQIIKTLQQLGGYLVIIYPMFAFLYFFFGQRYFAMSARNNLRANFDDFVKGRHTSKMTPGLYLKQFKY